MNPYLPQPQPTPSYQKHRRQFAWQILIPMLVFALLALGAAGFLSLSGVAGTRHLADVAVIWLALPLLVIGLAGILVLGGLVYLLARLLGIAPEYTGKAHKIIRQVAARISLLADKAVIPVVKINEVLAALQALKRK